MIDYCWIQIPELLLSELADAAHRCGMFSLEAQILSAKNDRPENNRYVEYALSHFAVPNKIEFDADTCVVHDDEHDGRWVMGWHYVSTSDVGGGR